MTLKVWLEYGGKGKGICVSVRVQRRQGHSYFFRQRDKDYSSNSISESVRYCVRLMRPLHGRVGHLLCVRRYRQGGAKSVGSKFGEKNVFSHSVSCTF